MSGAISPLPVQSCIAWTGTALPLPFSLCHKPSHVSVEEWQWYVTLVIIIIIIIIALDDRVPEEDYFMS